MSEQGWGEYPYFTDEAQSGKITRWWEGASRCFHLALDMDVNWADLFLINFWELYIEFLLLNS